jgi:C-terminal processing protease CtpA/Prc
MCAGFKTYLQLTGSGITGMVLDLRANRGGEIESIDCVASYFLKPGTALLQVASMRGAGVLRASGQAGRATDIALAVLIDQTTDGSALGLAAALQDQHRASIIGEPSEKVRGNILRIEFTPGNQDRFTLPIGDLRHLSGERLAVSGVRVDVEVRPDNTDALLAAASRIFADTRPAASH